MENRSGAHISRPKRTRQENYASQLRKLIYTVCATIAIAVLSACDGGGGVRDGDTSGTEPNISQPTPTFRKQKHEAIIKNAAEIRRNQTNIPWWKR